MSELFINPELLEVIKEKLQKNTRDELDSYYRDLITKVVYFDREDNYIELHQNITILYSPISKILKEDIYTDFYYNDMASEFRESIRKTNYVYCLELSGDYRKYRPLK